MRKEYYDKGSQGLKQLNVEDKVVVQHEETKRWDRKGSVVEKGDHRAIAAVATRLEDRDRDVRESAVTALGQLAEKGDEHAMTAV